MKAAIKSLINEALTALQTHSIIDATLSPNIQLERTRDSKHGDFACNLAMMLAKPAKKNPREIAQALVDHLPDSTLIANVDIAGPGFINFTLTEHAYHDALKAAITADKQYGQSTLGHNKKVHIEYVSANPTGPLHVGHGRGAAFGACVANLLTAIGYTVHREYYVNDAGRQMQILGVSIWLRYLQHFGEQFELPKNAYQGHYIVEIAETLAKKHGKDCLASHANILELIPTFPKPADEKDAKKQNDLIIDAYVQAAKTLVGEEKFDLIRTTGLNSIRDDIEEDLAEFGVTYNEWFRESKLIQAGLLQEGVNLLKEHGYTFEQDGALWFRATDLGDEKDRVLIRSNGQPTYFASDVAYHLYKYNKGFNNIIDVFGADHHGYIARIECFLKGLGKDPKKLNILLVQFAILYRGKEKVAMSTRAGEFVTLRELRHEVGNDAARYFYIMRKPEQHLDFDLELAKSQSNDNPVYYIQYAHARICSVWRQLAASDWTFDTQEAEQHLAALTLPHEKALLRTVAQFPELIETCATQHEPHTLAHYLQTLATQFHSYYNAEKFLVEQSNVRDARLTLIRATQIVLANGLHLLGLTAPESM